MNRFEVVFSSLLTCKFRLKGSDMNLSKKSVLGLALGGVALVTSSYFTAKRYVEHKQLRSDLNSIPWDVPKEYSSWKRLFSPNTNKPN